MAVFKSGTVTVSSAGSRVALPSVQGKCLWLRVTAEETNTGIIWFGDVTVATAVGRPLYQGTDGVNISTEVPCHVAGGVDLDSFYLDADNNNDVAYYEALLER